MSKQVHRKPGRRGAVPLLALFFVMLFGFSFVNLCWPKRTELPLENRKAARLPAPTVESLADGRWAAAFSAWMQDQFALRDGWINLQRAADEILFQKTEEDGILLGKSHWMFTKQFTVSEATRAQLAKNLAAVDEFAARYPGRVTFMLAPSAAVIYPEALPTGAPMIDENAMLDDIFAYLSANADVIDLRPAFTERKNEYLYYANDHHWTTNGAYRAYEVFCQHQGLPPFERTANIHPAVEVPGFYGTHYSAARLWNAQSDTITYYPLDNPMTVYQITGEAQFTPLTTGSLMNTAKFDTRDKYAAFLDGNNGYSTIEGDGEGSILVVKDSYANCFVPFLTANYARIGVVDFRSFAYGLDSTIEQEGYDRILILYNFQTFIADTKVIYINRPTTLS